MPVSKKRKSKKSVKQRAYAIKRAKELDAGITTAEVNRLRRIRLAAPSASALVAELTTVAETSHGSALQDELCKRLGAILSEGEGRPLDQFFRASDFAVALVDAAAGPLRSGDADAAAWRVLDASVQILPGELLEAADDQLPDVENLLADPERRSAPEPLSLAGQAQWTRDRYGSRFAVTAPFETPGSPPRWYLWDVDACTFVPVTVFSGFFGSPEEALAAWQSGVGSVAAGDARWTDIDDALLLNDILPREEGHMALGGETADQFAEYYRCRRLAEELLDPARKVPAVVDRPANPEPSEFAARYGERDVTELAEALAELWGGITPSLFRTCSPHRVAYVALAAHDEFGPDFAAEVLELLPDWVTWIAECSGLGPDLTARSLAYATGKPHPDLGSIPRDMDTQAVVVE
ncbi:hypothetical protein [Paractinoplanes lichenicola]|uniref:Uncharacterized protein n=1 Tax=Paractinoplanes lichenicola TaxID=2802976 RepID=A0ABS1VUL6_9ACTN|nr:hypothetical protein [Actinoplanes lichenicola]MBL7258151.1 hypothetical protein [Actinoplanes lichenicola]